MGKRPKGKKYTVMSVSGGSKKKRGKKEKDSDVLDRGYLDNPLAEKFDLSQPIDVDALMPTIKAYDQDEIQRQQKGADKGKRKKSRETAAERDGTAAAAAKISKRSKKERKKEHKLKAKEKRKAKREKKRLKRALKKQQQEARREEEAEKANEDKAPRAQGDDLLDDLYGFMSGGTGGGGGGDDSAATKGSAPTAGGGGDDILAGILDLSPQNGSEKQSESATNSKSTKSERKRKHKKERKDGVISERSDKAESVVLFEIESDDGRSISRHQNRREITIDHSAINLFIWCISTLSIFCSFESIHSDGYSS